MKTNRLILSLVFASSSAMADCQMVGRYANVVPAPLTTQGACLAYAEAYTNVSCGPTDLATAYVQMDVTLTDSSGANGSVRREFAEILTDHGYATSVLFGDIPLPTGIWTATWIARHQGGGESFVDLGYSTDSIECEDLPDDPPNGGGGGRYRPQINKPGFENWIIIWIEVSTPIVTVTHTFPDLDGGEPGTFWSEFAANERIDLLAIPDPGTYSDDMMDTFTVYEEHHSDDHGDLRKIEFDKHSLILFRDINGNAELDNFDEVRFSPILADGSPSTSAVAALAGFDAPARGGDGNGKLNAEDSVWSDLFVWVDVNDDNTPSRLEVVRIQDFFSTIVMGETESAGVSMDLAPVIHDLGGHGYPIHQVNLFDPKGE